MKVDYLSDTHFEFTEHRKPLPKYEVGECKVLQNCRGYYMEPSYSKFMIKSFEV